MPPLPSPLPLGTWKPPFPFPKQSPVDETQFLVTKRRGKKKKRWRRTVGFLELRTAKDEKLLKEMKEKIVKRSQEKGLNRPSDCESAQASSHTWGGDFTLGVVS